MEKKSKKVGIVVGIVAGLVAMTISYNVGKSAQDDVYSTRIDNKIYDYNKLAKRYRDLEGWVKDEEAKLDDKKGEVKEVRAAMKNRDKLEAKVDDLSSQVDEKKSEVDSLDSEIDSKQSELDKLTGTVQEKKEAPKTFSAGQYVVGQDFDEGRYKAVPVGEGSNFVVYDSSGQAVVNTILGAGQYAESEYVFYATDGQVMETQSTVKLIPVK
ncbi:hypothetical protein [Priestia aryabhattai]|uniref:hypothetical protein n=1 Tax=Priestia aryabhattai TaxID=412384 RepID=UPI002E1BD892|nr:hypothetical protein [Priestia aryabhattai]